MRLGRGWRADVDSQKLACGRSELRLAFANSNVTLYSAGRFHHAEHCALGTATSDSINFQQPSDSDAVLYLIADGGSVMTRPHQESALARGIRLPMTR